MQLLRRFFGRKSDPNDVAGMPIPPERLRMLTTADQFLVSYPRSGNTWTRYLVHDLLVRSRPDIPVPEERGALVPDIHRHDITSAALTSYGVKGRIMKSHNLRDLRGRRLVYLVRDPADALVSYYHFHLRYDRLRPLVQDGPDAFCHRMLPGWQDHVRLAQSYRKAAPDSVLFVQYEALLQNGVEQLQRVATFFGISTTPERLKAAVENNAFGRLRAEEEIKPLNPAANPEEFFFRKGQSGSAAEEVTAETMEMIRRQTAEIMSESRLLAAGSTAVHV